MGNLLEPIHHNPMGTRIPLALAALLLTASCGGRREEFISGRVLEVCDAQWPVCDQIAGCLLGDKSYTDGRFPGSGRVAIQVFEPSTVTVSLFLEELSAAGEETVISFFEDRCRSRVRESITGKTLGQEFERKGIVSRSADLVGVGDHLIEFESDAQARYLIKVEVVPKRFAP